jgi:hypothetical protein
MTAQQHTVVLDPAVTSRAVDAAIAKLHEDGHVGHDVFDRLVEEGLITQTEAQLLRALLELARSPERPKAATVVKDIDTMLKGDSVTSPTAVGILRTIRFAADAQASAERAGPSLVSKPPPAWEAAAEGAVEGGGLGAIAGAEVGSAGGPLGSGAGALIGGAIGGVAGAIVRGLGAWLSS